MYKQCMHINIKNMKQMLPFITHRYVSFKTLFVLYFHFISALNVQKKNANSLIREGEFR